MTNNLVGYSEFDENHVNNPDVLIRCVTAAIDEIAFIPTGYLLRVEYRIVKDCPVTMN